MATGTVKCPRTNTFGTRVETVFKNTTYTNLNTLATNEFPSGDNKTFLMLENSGNIDNCGQANRNFILGWANADNKYSWLLVIGFDGVYFAKRNNATNYSISQL